MCFILNFPAATGQCNDELEFSRKFTFMKPLPAAPFVFTIRIFPIIDTRKDKIHLKKYYSLRE